MCIGSEVGSYFRLIDFVYHSTLGLRVTKKKKIKIRNSYVRANTMHGEGNRILNPTAGAVQRLAHRPRSYLRLLDFVYH